VEFGESIDQAAIREVREETGLEVRIKRVVGMYVKQDEGALAITFEGEIVGGSMQQTTDETSACRYWSYPDC
jgi:8-oxo-dGTP diphosphatase